ncbi:MAG: hypothetical protein HC856_04285 [Pseudanabaena sp. RU_4_16]|nr:hypothetical protein [Pseudanabaena sp. RU_4_16]
MQVYWKTLILNIGSWIVAEVILNVVGLDNLANYSEFLYKPYLNAQAYETSIVTGGFTAKFLLGS